MNHTHADHGFTRLRPALVVLAQPPAAAQPGEGPLHDPALGQRHEPRRPLRPADHHAPERRPGEHLLVQIPGGVVAVGVDDLQARQFVPQPQVEQGAAGPAVMHVGGGDQHGQDQARAVHPQVPLAAVDLLAVVEAVRPADRRGLDGLAIGSGGTGAGVAASLAADLLTQGFVDPFPGAVPTPTAIPGMNGAPGREVLGQQAPLAAGADQVEDAIEDLAQVGRRSAHPLGFGQEGLDQGPLLIG